MSRKHALLSASGASKWLNCTPSAKLESTLPGTTSAYADEGTLAHDLIEVELKCFFGFIPKFEYKILSDVIKESEYYSESLSEYVKDYTDFCIGLYNKYDEPFVGIEDTVYLKPYIKKGFSHLDFMLIGKNGLHDVLHIADYKHGKGVPVYAENNKQLLIYALGAYLSYGFIYDIQTIKLTIFQPRINNITHWELSITELLDWAENELKPKAKIAYEGKGELKAGEWCRFCKAKATCRAFAKLNMDLVKMDFEDIAQADVNGPEPQMLTDYEIGLIVQNAEVFKNWINGVLDYALNKAKEGKQWPGLKLVHGRSNRRYTDPDRIIEILSTTWPKHYITTQKLLPITQLEKLVGQDNMKRVSQYIVKPEGNLSLVPDNDKRENYNPVEEIKNCFDNINT